jgi:YVTN family beta-propeller protein
MRTAVCLFVGIAAHACTAQLPEMLVTGKHITPVGRHTSVGSYPVNMALSPDGRWAAVTNIGFRQYLSIFDVSTGRMTSQKSFNASLGTGRSKEGLYFGIAWRLEGGRQILCASRGTQDLVSMIEVDNQGRMSDSMANLTNPSPIAGGRSPHNVAGVTVLPNGDLLVANNHTDRATNLRGSVSILRPSEGGAVAVIPCAGFPYAVASAAGKGWVSSERDGVVEVLDLEARVVKRQIRTGENPQALLPNKAGTRLYVANAGSDTVSVIDTASEKVAGSVLLRPDDVRGLTGCSPVNLALSPDEKRLYVPLGDMNCIAVLDAVRLKLLGYIPAGWYPTACVVSPDGRRLLFANAKGTWTRNPNGKPVGGLGQYVPNLIEGTVAVVDLPSTGQLAKWTRQVILNNRVAKYRRTPEDWKRPGIEHIIYVIKENRTYDQVLGDMPRGNGDPSLCMFPRPVTPNQHALAERFVLLDNFYVCAEVSFDGWQWSTAGMASAYTSRNSMYNYSGRGRNYDSEGTNNGVPVDLLDIRDVSKPGGDYLWDALAKAKKTYRNYGFFVSFDDAATRDKPGGRFDVENNTPNKKLLTGKTDLNFRQYDLQYADSTAYEELGFTWPGHLKTYGKNGAQSRIAAWKREFDEFVRNGNLPQFSMVRLGNDHTNGTTADRRAPRACVADNDYAVGQLVEAVSRSPYWKKTAIFILEDDAQAGYDHVDAHRSTAYVISPWVKRNLLDSRFYTTDSMLRTMGLILGFGPLCQYDAVAEPMRIFGDSPDNDEPYTAVMPDSRILTELNRRSAYGSAESGKLFPRMQADGFSDERMTDILWRAVMPGRPLPTRRTGLKLAEREAGEGAELPSGPKPKQEQPGSANSAVHKRKVISTRMRK